jgi:hypothetical protein
MYTYSFFILCIEFHVARMQNNFFFSEIAHITYRVEQAWFRSIVNVNPIRTGQ